MHGHYKMILGKLGNSINLTRPWNCVCNIIHKDNLSHMYAVSNSNKKALKEELMNVSVFSLLQIQFTHYSKH